MIEKLDLVRSEKGFFGRSIDRRYLALNRISRSLLRNDPFSALERESTSSGIIRK
jgi:hypothetical protein